MLLNLVQTWLSAVVRVLVDRLAQQMLATLSACGIENRSQNMISFGGISWGLSVVKLLCLFYELNGIKWKLGLRPQTLLLPWGASPPRPPDLNFTEHEY